MLIAQIRCFTIPITCLILWVFTFGASCRAETLRVGLLRWFRGVKEITVSANSHFRIDDAVGVSVIAGTSDTSITLKAVDKGVMLTRPDGTCATITGDLSVKPLTPGGTIKISAAENRAAQYRGAIEVRSRQNVLELVNSIDLEDYLLGVVPGEMPSHFHPEALKAQAVAARTYALVNMGKHKKNGFDLCDEVNCQIYLGADGEKPAAAQAVKETAGLVMVYDGQPIDAQFFSDCGGRTRDGGKPYLKSVPDRSTEDSPEFCIGSRNHTWSVLYTPGQLEPVLSKMSVGLVSHLKSITVKEVDESGRAGQLEITDDNGVRTITALELRRALGANVLRSSVFSVSPNGNGSFLIQGKGWGHGVGMCQQGANGMARPPYSCTFDKILKHYYTGVEITKLPINRQPERISAGTRVSGSCWR